MAYHDDPLLRERYRTKPRPIRSSFEDNSITFSHAYYKMGSYEYLYTDRTVDAGDFYDYRRVSLLEKDMAESRAKIIREQQQGQKRGLFEVNIPIKSGALESIAGEGGVGLKVSGTHQISFSGRSQWDDKNVTSTYRQSKFPSLNMEQISRFTINGTIGTKISVSVTQDSKTDIPLANRLMIRYKGEEDDVVKSIEAGNTTLSLPNTQFVGYSTRIQGLFGIKAEAQVGGLKLTTIASQEKGSTERTSINAGTSAGKRRIKDFQYADGRIFDLGRPGDFDSTDVITKIIIYRTFRKEYTQNAEIGLAAKMYVDLDDTNLFSEEKVIDDVEKMEEEEFFVNYNDHFIILEGALTSRSTLAAGVYMEIENTATGTVDTVGNILGDTLQLKLIKHHSPDNSMVTWNYLWRNVYSIRTGSGFSSADNRLDVNDLEIDIFKGDPEGDFIEQNLNHQDGYQYIRILGLDQIGQTADKGPDGKVDVGSEFILDPDRGLLIFPSRTPFADSSMGFTADALGDSIYLTEQVPKIYTEQYSAIETQQESKYYIEYSTKTREAQIRLGKPNIIEGSERITLNGEVLKKGEDYDINYDFGQLTLLNDMALDPNNDLGIDFEYSPFILAQKKTLFGVRGEYEFSKDLKAGATFLYKSDKATDRKPKVGQETSRMMVWDADASLRLKPQFITTLADALPFVRTEAQSNLNISGEIAQSYPNPNVDGVAYLDDFEGSRDAYSLGVFREFWKFASPPVVLDTLPGTLPDSVHHRARLLWYNPFEQTPTKEIYDQDIAPGEGLSHTLVLKFFSDVLDRRAGKVDSTLTDINDTLSWGGIMRALSTGAANQDRAQLVELRLKGNSGVLHIDLGQISEDITNDGIAFDEDEIGINKDVVEAIEDVGLDGMTDSLERAYYVTTESDPSGDNWSFDPDTYPIDYSRINGTEGNRLDPATQDLPDAEDLNRIGGVEAINNYFSYRIDLEDVFDRFLVPNSENQYGWKTYRIPVEDTDLLDTLIGNPDWKKINFVRLWVEAPKDENIELAIASFDIISSNWEKKLKATGNAAFSIAVINDRENIDYSPPPGVSGHYNSSTGTTETEQSLLLRFENFKAYDSTTQAADTGMAERFLINTTNLLGYRRLKMFVHGPPEEDAGSLLYFFRIGKDSANYYEVSRVLDPGWAGNEVNIDFNVITGLKEYLEQEKVNNRDTNVIVDTLPEGIYRVYGQPDITRVRYLANGVVNLDSNEAVTGDVWLDELRLTDVRRDVGLAARVSVTGSFADLFNYNFSYSFQNAFFRKISGSTRGGGNNNLGSGRSTKSYNYGVSFRLDRFLPRALGASIPVSWRYSKSTNIPQLRTGSDIILPEEIRDSESTVSTSKSFSISESFKKKTRNLLFVVLLNNLKTNFSYNLSEGRTPTVPMRFSENIKFGSTYSFNIAKPPSITPLFWTKPIPLLNKLSDDKLYLFINTFSARGDLNRSLSVSRNSNDLLNEDYRRDFRGDMKIGYKMFDNLRADYSMTTRRDLTDPELVVITFSPKKFKLGLETQYSQNFGLSYDPKLFPFLTHKGNFSTNYRENLVTNNNTRNVTMSKSYGISGIFDHKILFGGGKRTRGVPQQRRRIRAEEDDTVIKAKKESVFKKVLDPPARVMRFLTSWINAFNYDFKESYNYSYVGLVERAQLAFRFGITEDIGARQDSSTQSTGRSNSISKSTSYSLRSGTTFFGGLKTDVTFSRSIRQDVVTRVNPKKSVSTKFPDINFTLRQFTTFKFINPIIRKFSPRFKYSRSTDESIDLSSGIKTSKKVSVQLNPLLSFNFTLLKGMVINFKTSKSITEDNRFNQADGSLNSINKNVQNSTNVSTKYSFTWPKGIRLPLFGRLKIKSTLSLSVDVTMRGSTAEDYQVKTGERQVRERSDLLVTPSISYSFSSQIKGGLTGRWQDTNDKSNNRKQHVREIRIWVDIRF